MPCERGDQLRVVARVGLRLARVARALHAGRAAERAHADARIVGQRRQLRLRARVARLRQRVLDERDVRLVGFGNAERPPAGSPRCRAARASGGTRAACRGCWKRGRARDRSIGRSPRSRVHAAERRLLRRDRAARMPRSARPTSASISAARERRALGGALQLDEAAGAGHHDVHVGVARRILGVVEIEHRHAVDHTDRHRGDEIAQRLGRRRDPARGTTRSRRRARRRRR